MNRVTHPMIRKDMDNRTPTSTESFEGFQHATHTVPAGPFGENPAKAFATRDELSLRSSSAACRKFRVIREHNLKTCRAPRKWVTRGLIYYYAAQQDCGLAAQLDWG